jgi:general secretion pathway protein N
LIRSIRGLTTTGVLTLVLGLIVMFPARVAIGWFAPAEVTIGGIQGSVWHGSANEAAVNGLYMRDIKWSLNALRLFTGELSYSVDATPVSGFLESDVSIGYSGALTLSDLTAALPLDLLADATNVPGLQGNVSLSFERVEIVDGLATAADGTAQFADLMIPIFGRDSLGGYKAEFFTQNNGITASIEDTDGVLDMAGSLQLSADRSFEFIALVIAKPEAPQRIRQLLQTLPAANDRGQRELRYEGIL